MVKIPLVRMRFNRLDFPFLQRLISEERKELELLKQDVEAMIIYQKELPFWKRLPSIIQTFQTE